LEKIYNIFFRVDSSLDIGIGHLYRCISLANEFQKRSHRCIFLSQHIHPLAESKNKNKAFDTKVLPSNPLVSSEDINKEISFIRKLCKNTQHNIIIIDSYRIDCRWEKAASDFADLIVVIDDIANRYHFADFIIDHNNGRQRSDYAKLNIKNGEVLLGPKYAILNTAFKNLRNKAIARNRIPVRNVLINFGGSNLASFTKNFISELKKFLEFQKYNITVLTSQELAFQEDFIDICNSQGIAILFDLTQPELASLYIESDFCIGAGGVSALERCLFGLPSALFCIAKNQIRGSLELQRAECAQVIDSKERELGLIEILKLLSDHKRLRLISTNSMNLVDGQGVERIINKIFTNAAIN